MITTPTTFSCILNESQGIIPDVSNWLIDRVEKRMSLDISINEREELLDVLGQCTIAELIGKATYSEDAFDLTTMVIMEAKCVLTALSFNKNKYLAYEATVDEQAMERMQKGREYFENNQPEFLERTRNFWENEAHHNLDEMVTFNTTSEKMYTSVVLPTISRRFGSLVNRIKEFGEAYNDTRDMELIIAVGDTANYGDYKDELFKILEQTNFQTKVLFSKKNLVAVNRNLSVWQASGEYYVFWDDDVKLVGPVLQTLIANLEMHPEAGTTQAFSYDHNMYMHKPWIMNYKCFYKENILLINNEMGMIIAMRSSIVKAVPYPELFNNYGENQLHGQEVVRLGYLHYFVTTDDAYTIHDHVDFRLTNSPNTKFNNLIYETITYYLQPFKEKDILFTGIHIRLSRYSDNNALFQSEILFNFFDRGVSFIEGDEQPLLELAADKDNWILWDEEQLFASKLIEHLNVHRDEITAYKKNYMANGLADINPYLGPMAEPKLTDEIIQSLL